MRDGEAEGERESNGGCDAEVLRQVGCGEDETCVWDNGVVVVVMAIVVVFVFVFVVIGENMVMVSGGQRGRTGGQRGFVSFGTLRSFFGLPRAFHESSSFSGSYCNYGMPLL